VCSFLASSSLFSLLLCLLFLFLFLCCVAFECLFPLAQSRPPQTLKQETTLANAHTQLQEDEKRRLKREAVQFSTPYIVYSCPSNTPIAPPSSCLFSPPPSAPSHASLLLLPPPSRPQKKKKIRGETETHVKTLNKLQKHRLK
jgi:hypothetical protein